MKNPDDLLVSRLSLALMEHLPRRHNGGAVVLVTSALPGEGKTFVARLLAKSVAELGEEDVCLVSTGGASAGPGFADLLAGLPIEATPTIRSTRLFAMSAGQEQQQTALFQPKNVARALGALRPRFGLCIIDGTTVAQCGALLRCVDQVLLVVDSRSTPPQAIRRSLAQVGGTGLPASTSVVLNHAPGRTLACMDGY